MNESPQVTRVRHELKRRRLTIARIDRLAPKMLRVVLCGEELTGFTSLAFDDHVKLFFAADSHDAQAEPAMRDFTPRRYDADRGELWIDFYLHEAGPAASWAAHAVVGETLALGGPRGSSIIALEGIDAHVFIGDETALPAIARRLEELPAQVRALVILATEAGAHAYPLVSKAQLEVVWLPTGEHATQAGRIIHALRAASYPTNACFTWVAAESQVARAIRRHLMTDRGIAKEWIKAAGYWRHGAVGTHETITDEG